MSTSSKIVVVSSLYMLLACLILLYTTAQGSRREALDFTIGVGSGSKDRDLRKACNDEHHTLPFKLNCPLPRTNIETLPAVPSESEILVFADQRLAVVYPVIQRFKSIITSDPLGITKTWVGSDICSYKGFYCDYPPDNKSAVAVASIDFTGFQLSAPTLDGFLDQLPDIALFHANSNNFSGTLSPNIAKLRYLYELDISNNQFSGPFPTAVLGMTGLTFLDIRFKFFTGSVPAQIFTQDLDALFINNNNFMIQLPENIGETHVLFLTLANNKFNGPLPRSIFKAFSSLPEVLLLNDQLTGCIPYEIGLLKEAVVFDAGNNQLTGHLPFSLACLENLEQLNFAGNLLFGTVPEVLCELGKLVNLSLSDNYFTHVGPLCRILIERGVLDVRNNCIPDLPFQKSVADCANFFAHPRTCPRMWSYTNIPCSHFPYSSSIPEMAPSP
ncbi:hypothetical protein DITRI_Ditri03aG0189800 [Diplodiscus trichospermus]